VNVILDPVWPWSYLWEVLGRVPHSILLVALLAALAGLLVPVLWLARAARRSIYVTASVCAASLALVGRHAWPIVHASSFWPAVGGMFALALLLLAPALLAGVSVGTYIGAPDVSRRRLATVVSLRLLAFLLALIAIARPALAWIDREQARSQLLIALDRSRSMTIQDATGNSPRWTAIQRALEAGGPALERLRDELGVDVRIFSFGDELADWNPDLPGEADAKRSEIGQGLRALLERRDARLNLRGALLLSDGGDNGSVPALGEASRYRGLGSSLHTFVVGNPATTLKQNDIAITSISTSPTPFVPLKGKMTVKVTIDARGFENTKRTVALSIELPDETGKLEYREVVGQNVSLPLTVGNEVTFVADAPTIPGEYKIKVQVKEAQDDFPLNDFIETFVTVSKEGTSVLIVDRRRTPEPQSLIDALTKGSGVSIDRVWVSGDQPPAGGGKLALLDDRPFDVIILGDVSVAQLKALDPAFLVKMEKQIARGAGLLVTGGYINLSNGDWKDSALAQILPVDLTVAGQVEEPTRIVPTDDGKRLAAYILRIDDEPELESAWTKLAKLDGFVPLTLLPENRRGLDQVLATADDDKKTPIMVMRTYAGAKAGKDAKGEGSRILVFGGDTTWRWVRDPKSRQMHGRFWRQMLTWVARQEDAQGSVWVRPDATSRRLPVGAAIGFAVGIRGKGGADIRDGKFTAEVTSPDGAKSSVPLERSTSETRGVFAETRKPGTYKITVSGEGKDPSGEMISGQASARVIVYDEDIEMTRPAADPEFMRKLATAGGGEALTIEQLPEFLNRLAEQPLDPGKQKMDLRPDWRSTARSGFLIGFFVAFVAVVGLEWALRRWWGMV
jgi:uncharacterized membrane protein